MHARICAWAERRKRMKEDGGRQRDVLLVLNILHQRACQRTWQYRTWWRHAQKISAYKDMVTSKGMATQPGWSLQQEKKNKMQNIIHTFFRKRSPFRTLDSTLILTSVSGTGCGSMASVIGPLAIHVRADSPTAYDRWESVQPISSAPTLPFVLSGSKASPKQYFGHRCQTTTEFSGHLQDAHPESSLMLVVGLVFWFSCLVCLV